MTEHPTDQPNLAEVAAEPPEASIAQEEESVGADEVEDTGGTVPADGAQ